MYLCMLVTWILFFKIFWGKIMYFWRTDAQNVLKMFDCTLGEPKQSITGK